MLSSGGAHNVVLKSDGTVWAWGANGIGQVGIGSTAANVALPAQISSLGTSTVFVGTGQNTGYAVKNDGSLWLWGYNAYYQMGDGTQTVRRSPFQLFSGGVRSAAGGGYYSVCAMIDGTMWAWGNNGDGQLGDGTTTARPTPVQVLASAGTPLTGVTSVACGGYHTVAIRVLNGVPSLWAWGRNYDGELGFGTGVGVPYPTAVAAFDGSTPARTPVAIAGGLLHTLVVAADGSVWATGSNANGQLGNTGVPSFTRAFVQVGSFNGTAPWKAVDVASNPNGKHSVVLRGDGTVWSTGYNADGELGNNSTTQSLVPVQAAGLDTAVMVSAGQTHSAALLNGGGVGSVSTWGLDTNGQLGDNATAGMRLAPANVYSFIVAKVRELRRTLVAFYRPVRSDDAFDSRASIVED